MGCFSDSPSDSTDASVPSQGPTDAGTLPGGVSNDPTSPVTACPNSCANTLRIDGCRAVGINGTIELQAVIDCGTGNFHWSTTSTKVTLTGVDSQTVQVRAGAQPSAGRDQEVITVQYSYADCSPLSATINLTVVSVVFSESPAESYGYDTMDTPTHTDDHVSVKQLDQTVVHVVVQGGLNGSDLVFRAEEDNKARIDNAPAQASFDLTIHGQDQTKAETRLFARVTCPASPEITRMFINVYKEKVVRAVVAKVYDSRHAGTNLRFPNLSVPSAQAMINPKAKAAVVRYELSDYSATGGAIDIPYDNDGNGKLSYDIAARGGAEFNAIRDGIRSADIRIAVIRDIVSLYFLDAAAAIGDRTIRLRGINNNNYFTAGSSSTLGTGGGAEPISIQTASRPNATVTLASPLTKAHAAGEQLTFPADGWSSDPILVIEGSATEDYIKALFYHETGHRALTLADVTDPTNIMNDGGPWTDYRLRYKLENKKYDPGTENQWETIPRT